MTYTVIGRCARTGQLGIGITTFSLAVGGYCPTIRAGLGAVSSQAFADPTLRETALGHLDSGRGPEDALSLMEDADPHFSYRQIGIVSHDGAAAAWTGDNTRRQACHVTGQGFVAMGNSLASTSVVEHMAEEFASDPSLGLDERLLRTLEAGRDAGGQAGSDGIHMGERSSALIIVTPDALVPVDVRVDMHETAVEELRRVYSAYRPYMPYYELRAVDPPVTPAQDVWVRENT